MNWLEMFDTHAQSWPKNGPQLELELEHETPEVLKILWQ